MSVGDGLRSRLAAAAGAEEFDRLALRVDSLEVAVPENTFLADALGGQVGDLERAVAMIIERAAGPGVKP